MYLLVRTCTDINHKHVRLNHALSALREPILQGQGGGGGSCTWNSILLGLGKLVSRRTHPEDCFKFELAFSLHTCCYDPLHATSHAAVIDYTTNYITVTQSITCCISTLHDQLHALPATEIITCSITNNKLHHKLYGYYMIKNMTSRCQSASQSRLQFHHRLELICRHWSRSLTQPTGALTGSGHGNHDGRSTTSPAQPAHKENVENIEAEGDSYQVHVLPESEISLNVNHCRWIGGDEISHVVAWPPK